MLILSRLRGFDAGGWAAWTTSWPNRTCSSQYLILACLCGSLAQCALSLKRLSAGPGFNPQTRLN